MNPSKLTPVGRYYGYVSEHGTHTWPEVLELDDRTDWAQRDPEKKSVVMPSQRIPKFPLTAVAQYMMARNVIRFSQGLIHP